MAEEEKKDPTEEEKKNESKKELTEDELLTEKKKKMLGIAIGLSALLILLMIGGYFLFIKDDEVPLGDGVGKAITSSASTGEVKLSSDKSEVSTSSVEDSKIGSAGAKESETEHTHTRGEWKVVKEATCSEEGIEEEICPDCNEKLDERKIPTTPHKWVDVTEVVHHDAVTEERWVQDREAYDEEVVDVSAYTEEKYNCYCGASFSTPDGVEAHFSDPNREGDHFLTEPIPEIINHPAQTHTEHHDAQGHMETFTVQEAYDETVVTGQQCSVCGAKK